MLDLIQATDYIGIRTTREFLKKLIIADARLVNKKEDGGFSEARARGVADA